MSRWDKIRLSSEDCQFIWDWLSEKDIARSDIDTFPPVFNKWEIELKLKSHDLWQHNEITEEQAELLNRFDKERYGDKYEDIQLNVRCRVLSEEKNIIRFNTSLYRAGKTIDKMSYTVRIVILRTYDDILKERRFIEECKDGSGEFSITQAGLESFESFHFEEAVEIGALLNIPRERTIETIEKQMLPAIFLAECDSSRKDDSDGGAAQLKDLALNLYINVSLFLAYFKPEVSKYATRETAKDTQDGQQKKAKASKKKKKQNDVYSVINISKYITDIKSGHEKLPRRKCPYAYKVRGHFRHYKSGKKVWISEFTKNTEEKRKARTIKLSGVKKHQKQNKS